MKKKAKDMTLKEIAEYCASKDESCNGCKFSEICDKVFIGTPEIIYNDFNIESMEIEDGTSN